MKNNLVFNLGQLVGQLNDADRPYYYVQKTLNKLSSLPDKRGVIAYNFNKYNIYSGAKLVQDLRHIIANHKGHQLVRYEYNALSGAKNYFGTWLHAYSVKLSDGSRALGVVPITTHLTSKVIDNISNMYLLFKRNDLDETETKILEHDAKKRLAKQHKPATHRNIALAMNQSVPF